jgi:hypothetical protein
MKNHSMSRTNFSKTKNPCRRSQDVKAGIERVFFFILAVYQLDQLIYLTISRLDHEFSARRHPAALGRTGT